jgi:hypothetical protein
MDRKGVIRYSLIAGFVLMLIVLVLLFSFSSAILDRESYILGERVRIDMSGKVDYRLKITTPSTSYSLEGSDDSFVFRPEEAGLYKVQVLASSGEEIYQFEVIEEWIEMVDNVSEELIVDVNRSFENSTDFVLNISEENSSFVNETYFNESYVNYSINYTARNDSDEEGFRIEINKPVEWKVRESLNGERVKIKVPVQVEDFEVSVIEEGERQKVSFEEEIPVLSNLITRVRTLNDEFGEKRIVIDDVVGEVEVSYTTPAPEAREKIISEKKKEVVVSSPDGFHYEDILAYSEVPEVVSSEGQIKIYWVEEGMYVRYDAEDRDGDGLIDFVSWNVPHLSEQTFQIILISKADHLNSSRGFIRDVYAEVGELDGVYKEIPAEDFVRVTFERNLSFFNDITLYARSSGGSVEVYESGKNDLIATFGKISEEGFYKIYLDELIGTQDTFDLKVVGGAVEFDYITDPSDHISCNVDNCTEVFNTTGATTWTAPYGVTSVTVIAIGGGGGGSYGDTAGDAGGGGGLGRGTVAVTPGDTYDVVVGVGGARDTDNTVGSDAGDGGDSYFINDTTVAGLGGEGANAGAGGAGGGFVGDSGGNGGDGGTGDNNDAAGGGGAGGYSGDGGDGAGAGGAGSNGVGGGGGGGGSGGNTDSGGGGGGTGIPEEGSSGTGGADSACGSGDGCGGVGGSGGEDGLDGDGPQGDGGLYGGGGGGAENTNIEHGDGAQGVVVLIYPNVPHPTWWNESWYKRKEINLTSSAALTNFPYYLNVTYDSNMQSDYDDLRFIEGSCSTGNVLELSYEIESYTASKADVWVGIPDLAAGITTICMYYHNPTAANGEDVEGVWDENYTMVFHMNNETSTLLVDSSGNNNGTKISGTQPTEISGGKIGNAQSFDGDGSISVPLTFAGGPVTFEYWTYIDSSDSTQQTNSFASDGNRMASHLPWSGTSYWDYGPGCCGTRLSTSFAGNYDDWTHVAYTSGAGVSSNTMQIIFNGVEAASNSLGTTSVSSTSFNIGSGSGGGGAFLIGDIDEFRMSNFVRSPDWINMSYQVIENPNTMTTFGEEEAGYGILNISLVDPAVDTNVERNAYFNFTVEVSCLFGNCGDVNVSLDPPSDPWWNISWKYRKSLHINSSSDGALTNYQKKIVVNYGDGTDSDLQVYLGNKSNIDFSDVRFANASGGELDYYIVQQTNSSQAAIFVEVDSIPASGGADIYIYYNATGVSSASSGSATFDEFESWDNAASSSIDTAGGNGGINFVAASNIKEGSGAARTDDGSTDTYRTEMQNDNTYDVDDYIVEGWLYIDSAAGGDDRFGPGIHAAGAPGSLGGYQAIIDARSAQSPQIRVNTSNSGRTNGNFQVNQGEWYLVNIFRSGGSNVQAELWTEAQVYGDTPQTTSTRGSDTGHNSGYTGVFTYSSDAAHVDASWVRKRTDDEPLFDTWGKEEELNLYKSGLISMVSGDFPFYTISENPTSPSNNSCLSDMKDGDSCNITWIVNATGILGTDHEFFAFANSTNFSESVPSAITQSINLTIYEGERATINSFECEESGSWQSCDNIDYGETLTRIRVNCTYSLGAISEVTFNLTNVPDGNTLWYGNATSSSGDFWIFDDSDILIEDSGEFRFDATCYDVDDNIDENYTNWTVPWGEYSISLITPTENTYIIQNDFFNFSSNFTCVGGECGSTTFALDPPAENYIIVVYNESGNFTVPSKVNQIDVLVVAGGGAGGSHVTYSGTGTGAGGGGAGGLNLTYNYSVTAGEVINITVGAGGISPATQGVGGNGEDSIFGDIVAVGGGGGGYRFASGDGADGGSGGGGGYQSDGGSGTPGQGNDGGSGTNDFGGSGGGGAGGAGPDGDGNNGRDGGAGLNLSDTFGTDVGENGWFAGGGAGGGQDAAVGGTGALGGGGDGGANADGTDGLNGTGGGGGGSGDYQNRGGSGGSGIVIIGYYQPSKVGLIPMEVGSNPFYTLNQNPYYYQNDSCLADMKDGDFCSFEWSVNATGTVGSVHEFYTVATSQNYSSYFGSTESEHVNLTIVSALPPILDITYPLSLNYSTNRTELNYTVTIEGSETIDSCWYTLNGSLSNTTINCGDNVTGISSNEGINTWTVYSNNSAGDTSFDTVTFYIDSSLPNGTLISPANDTFSYNDTFNFTTNASDNYGLENATLFIYNSTGGLVYDETVSVSGTEAVIGIVYQFLSSGVYTWFYNIVDSAGNIFSTSNRTLEFLKVGTLNVQLVDPSTHTNVNPGEFFTFTVNVSCTNGECGDVNVTLDPVGWWDAQYTNRKEINFSSTYALADFPVFVNVSFENEMQADYDDLRFVNGSCESGGSLELDYEIEGYDSSAADVWLKIPNLANGVTSVCMYYGNTIASSGQNASGVWEDYSMVLHMNNITATSVPDSTGVFNGTKRSVSQPTQVTGKIGRGQSFDGDGYIDIPLSWGGGPVTIEFWNYVASGDVNQQTNVFASDVGRMASHTPWSGTAYWDYGTNCCSDDRISTAYGAYTNDWTYVTYTSTGTGGGAMEIFFNGASAISNSAGGTISGISDFNIGSNAAGNGAFFIGDVDEFRISDSVRSDGWIEMSYEFMENQAGLVSFGEAETNNDKGGAVSTVPGTYPFYTTDENPMTLVNTSCLGDMMSGDSCVVTWNVNATGNIGTTWEFFVIANSSNYSASAQSVTINITIGNLPPLVPELNYPLNGSSISVIAELNWSNTTDPTGDDVYYILQVANDSNFSNIVYYNGSITETIDPTGDTPTGIVTEGQYYWRVLATDLNGNSSWSEANTFFYDLSPPNISLLFPANDTTNTTTSTQHFVFNVTDLSSIASCDLIINGVVNQTNTSITRGISQSIISFLPNGIHQWSINCTDDAGFTGASETRTLNLTVADNPPSAGAIYCEEGSSGIFADCSNIVYADNLTTVRVFCSDPEGNMSMAYFNLTNDPDNSNYFYLDTTDNTNGNWSLDVADTFINDSGNFTLIATCVDGEGLTDSNTETWLVPWGTPTIDLVNPSSNSFAQQYLFFNFTANVGCSGGECAGLNVTLDPVGWWDADWEYRKNINLTSSANLTNFPVYLNVSYDSDMQTDFEDLRFINGSCTAPTQNLVLAYEIENYTATKADIWLNVPGLALGSTEVCMYYGNSGALSGENASNVWDDNYEMVFHMNNYNSTHLIDSTGNYNGTKRSATQPVELSAGRIGPAQDFNGDAYIDVPLSHSGGPVTFEFWNYIASADSTQQTNVFAGGDRMNSHSPYSGTVYFDYGPGCCGDRISTSYAGNYDQWKHITYTSAAGVGSNEMQIFFDGSQIISNSAGDNDISSSDFKIGSNYAGSGAFHAGNVDEFRMSTIVRSDEWINMTYQFMANPSTMVSFGSEEKGKSGAISTIVGDTPFYTISANPTNYLNTSCLGDIRPGNYCEVTWEVNATGPLFSTWEFFVFANTINYTSWFSSSGESARINITIVNQLAPSVPVLNAPANGSSFGFEPDLNWTNSTDVNGDAIFYALEVSNVSNFSTIVYANYSIAEQQNPTQDSPSLPGEGTYFWRVLATDLIDNSSWSETWQFVYDLSGPNLTFINQSGEDGALVNDTHPLDEGENLTISVNVSDVEVSGVWVVVWATIKGGAELFRAFFDFVGNDLWQVIIPTNSSWGTSLNYTIYANDTINQTTEYDGNFTLLKGDISLIIDPDTVSTVGDITAYGHLNLTNGSSLGNHPINIYLDGVLLLLANLTAEGTYDNYLEFNDTTSNEFDLGTYSNITTNSGNLTLSGGNTSGTYSRILDAGARVEWGAIDLSTSGAACSAVVTYQEGDVNGYGSTGDTYISSTATSINYGAATSLSLDGSPTERVLIQFGDLFGKSFNRIPYNSTILGANITFVVSDPGNIVNVYEVLENWTEMQATYNNRLTSTAWSVSGASGAPSRSSTLEDSFTAGSPKAYAVDVSNAVERWVDHTSENYGVIFDMATSNGIVIRSSEYSTQSERPQLTVQYSSEDCTNLAVYVRTSNDKSTWSSWQAVSDGDLISDSNVASRYLEYYVEMSSTQAGISPSISELVVNYTATVTDSSGDFRYNFTNPSATGSYEVNVSSGLRTIFMNASATLTVDTGTAPNVTIDYPDNGTWFGETNVSFGYTVVDPDDDLTNSTLFIDGVANTTNQSAISTETNIFDVNFSSGFYNWSIEVYDANNLYNTTEVRWFYVDLIDPNVSLVYPPNDTSYSSGELNLSFNASDNLDSVLSCDVVLDSNMIYTGLSANNGEFTNVSSGTLVAGVHYWNVTCFDEVNRSFTSPTYQFNISDIPPTLLLVYPDDGYVDDDGDISFVFNASDNSGFINATLIINGSFYAINDSEINNGQNSSINATSLGEGFYNWTVIVYDLSSQNATDATRTFTVDLNSPTVDLNSPEDNSVVNSSSVEFNFTANDTIDPSLSCDLVVNGFVEDSFSAFSYNLTSRTLNNLIDGQKFWNVVCTDDAGHQGTSPIWSVNVSEPPTVILNTDNETSFLENSINLSYTPSDNTNISSCDLYLNGAYNQTNATALTNGQQSNFSVSNLAGGTYYWYVNCTDVINLTGVSETRQFSIDTFGPNITLHEPNGDEIGTLNITFNFTATDDFDSSFVCDLSVDDSVVDSNFTVNNGTTIQRNVSGITDGFHLWYVNCTDSATNIGGSEIFNFTKSTPPIVNLIEPNDTYWFNTSSFYLIYYPVDDEGFIESSLYINDLINDTNSSEVLENQNNNFSVIGFPDGEYNWTVKVTDVRGLNSTAYPNRTFYVDTQTPNLVLNNPGDNASLSTNNVTLNFTASDNLDPSLLCNLYLDGELEYSDNSTNGDDVLNSILVGDGVHYWNVTCYDEAGNFNASEEYNFTVEAPPNVTLISPENYDYFNYSVVEFVYLPEDPIGIENCSLYVDGVWNASEDLINSGVNNSFNVSGIGEGFHNWTVECVDAAPDYNAFSPTEWNFTMDRTPPVIDLVLPEDGSTQRKDVIFNFSVTDNLDPNLVCDLYIDGIVNVSSILVANGSSTQQYVDGLSLGTHYWNVTCVDNATNLDWSATWEFETVLIDLEINESDIVFSTDNPTENESVVINATVHNLASVGIYNVTVQFFDGDPDDSGVQIGSNQTIPLISNQSQEVVSVSWDAGLGTSDIFVLVDPPIDTNGSIEEVNETNNVANKSINVGAWHFVYGEIDSLSKFDLADSGNDSIIRWDAANYNDGNVYVADSDSEITWTELQALGKTAADADQVNDFGELDAYLSMTGFPDSISALYLDGGVVSVESSYYIFNNFVDEVPQSNSTNNTNFYTGILWDVSDDGDGMFGADQEDIVFVSGIEQDLVGAFGTYDYEIRIPATLREYKGGGRSVVFYAELK